MKRRSIWMPEELWKAIQQAAARDTIATGQLVTPSEWIRRTLERAA